MVVLPLLDSSTLMELNNKVHFPLHPSESIQSLSLLLESWWCVANIFQLKKIPESAEFLFEAADVLIFQL
jgi:hypothetical protein